MHKQEKTEEITMKINKTLIILSLLLIFCISLGAVSAADNTDISVNDTNDDVATVESSVNVDDEISTVSEGIHYSSEIYEDIKSATGTYYITEDYQIDTTWEIPNANVIIEGNNHTIYGNSKRAFNINGSNVTIKNLNFVNSTNAIKFYNDGSVSGCSFVNCRDIYAAGGAICFVGNGDVSCCSFVNCMDTIEFYNDSSDGSVSDCSFVNCSAIGGAIHSYGGGFVSGCSFVNCSAHFDGGAISFHSLGFVSDCSFVGCSAGGAGGAIYSGGSVSGCSFVNCSSGAGGAIYFTSTNGVVSGCSFVGCSAGYGGAIHSGGSVSGCSFVNCSSIRSGGAISFVGNGDVSGCSFVGCSAGYAGAISFDSNGSVSGCSFVNCSANDKGGAISFAGGGSVNYCIFENNNASVGKAIYGGLNDYNFNFFSFKNDINFPKGLIGNEIAFIIPNSWVVLDVTNSGDEYIVKFVSDEGNSLSENMPDYNASLSINGVAKEIFIKNNTYNDTYVDGNYVVTSLNTGNVLANITFNNTINCSMNVSVENITYGEDVTIDVTLPSDATGDVTLFVNSSNITKSLDNGKVSFNLNDLGVASYKFTLKYYGDEKYSSKQYTGSFNVEKYQSTITVSASDVSYGSDVTVNVNLDVVNGTGNITYYLNGKEYATGDISNLTLVINNLSAGTYYLTVEYSGDLNNTKSSAKCNFTVSKNNTYVMSVSAINVTVGEDEVIVVNVPTDAIGNVIICVNGTNYSATVKEGVAKLPLKDLKVGNYSVTAYYSDNNYELNTVNTIFIVKNIAKLDSFVSVDDLSCKLNCPVDLVACVVGDTGLVTFYVNNVEVNTVNVVDGLAKLSYYANVSGNLTVKAVYSGSDLYNPSENTSTLFVNSSKFKSNVVVDSVVITKGDSVNLVAHLDSDATGFITFYVNGSKIGISEVEDGIAKYTYVPNNVGKYVIKAVYTGDDKYSSSEAEGNLTVKEISKLGTSLTASGLTINAYASKNLVVTLKDSNGKVLSGKKLTIAFNGKNYTVTTNASGQAKLAITSKVVKNYTATIKFAGDTAYTGSSKSVKVVIKPAYVTVADIIKAAKTLKSYSVKNKKLPSTIKVGSYKLTHAQLTYLMTVAIKHIKAGKKTSTKVKVINVKYTTYNAKISKKIMKNGYLSVVNTLYSKGVKGTLPKYFTYGGKKIGYNAYAYSLAKILAFYSSNKRLPNYCVFVNY